MTEAHPVRWMRIGTLTWRGLPPWAGVVSTCGKVRAGRVVVDAGTPFVSSDPTALACYIDNTPRSSAMKSETRAVPMSPAEFFKRRERRGFNAAIVEKAGGRRPVVVDDNAAGVDAPRPELVEDDARQE